jgi:hypothetical protein
VDGLAVAKVVVKVADVVVGSAGVMEAPVSAKVKAGVGASAPAGTSIPTDDEVKTIPVEDWGWAVVVTTTTSVITVVVVGRSTSEAAEGMGADSTVPEGKSPAVIHDWYRRSIIAGSGRAGGAVEVAAVTSDTETAMVLGGSVGTKGSDAKFSISTTG